MMFFFISIGFCHFSHFWTPFWPLVDPLTPFFTPFMDTRLDRQYVRGFENMAMSSYN